MYNDSKGKVKEALWTRPTCTDESDPLSKRRKARRDYWRDCREEGESADNLSPDLIGEAQELTEEGIG